MALTKQNFKAVSKSIEILTHSGNSHTENEKLL